MLTPLDDTLWHQVPAPFSHAGTSDPRFFDRYWFAIYSLGDGISLQVTMGSYSNTNVLDAGVMVLEGTRQHNLRVSRALRPAFETSVGPLRIEAVRPLEQLRLVCDPGVHGFSFDLLWSAIHEPEEEKPHFSRLNGRIQEDYQRFNQVGSVSGTLAVGGRTVMLDRWWSARDHSWGIRPGIGGPQPANGEPGPPEMAGSLFCFLFFSSAGTAGHIQIAERRGERAYLTGLIRMDGASGEWAEYDVREADLRLDLIEGTRRPSRATIRAQLSPDRQADLVLDAAGPSFAMTGLGYGGWDDCLGLGVYRGLAHEEHETWDVSHPADVLTPSGAVERPAHRIQPVRMTVRSKDIEEMGTGSLTLVAVGRLPKYGLE